MKKKIRPTHENLRCIGIKLLMNWLIDVAKKKERITYGEVKRRLEENCFTSMGNSGAIVVGNVLAESMQKKIFKQKGHKVPLLNALIVNQRTNISGPSECIRKLFYKHFPEEVWLRKKNALSKHPKRWEELANRAIQEVHDYSHSHWSNILNSIDN